MAHMIAYIRDACAMWLRCEVEIDRRMLDYCVGLDTEFGELVEARVP